MHCSRAVFMIHRLRVDAVAQVGGLPSGDDEIADELRSLLLTREYRSPMETPRYVKQLMMKWHSLLAPGHA